MMADRGDAIAVDGFKFNTKYSFLYDHFGIACLTRMAIIIYGEFHDNVFHLNYTDVDYHVFSDAAQWVSLVRRRYLVGRKKKFVPICHVPFLLGFG